MHRTILTLSIVAALHAVAGAQEAKHVDRPVDQSYIKRLAAGAEPGGKGAQDRLAQYVSHFRHEAVNDTRLFAFDVAAEAEGERGVRLTGYVEYPETRNAVVAYFKALDFEPVENQIETLPSMDLGEKRFGFIKSFHALSYAGPEEKEVVTDCLLGESLFLLKEESDHFLVHGGDGYLGWVAAKDVERVDESTFAEYLEGPRVFVKKYQIYKDSASGVDAPSGANLKLVREEPDHYVVKLPSGEGDKVPKAIGEVRQPPKQRIDLVCAGARELLGTEYLWGGKTKAGVDCSGLVQVSFAGAGVTVPRDANQQFHMGQLTGTRWSRAAMRRGDTLYFINPQGRISHTGLYLGDDQFIHAVSPVVVINSFNPEDKNYDPARHASFAFAKRVWE